MVAKPYSIDEPRTPHYAQSSLQNFHQVLVIGATIMEASPEGEDAAIIDQRTYSWVNDHADARFRVISAS